MCVRSCITFYGYFNLDMDRSPGFGSISYDLFALFRLDFSSASYLKYLTLPYKITRRTVLQKVRSQSAVANLPLFVSTRFQVLFHSPPGVLFTFPSRYCFTIGHQVVFSLMGWSPLLHTRLHVSRTTLDTTMSSDFSHTRLSLSLVYFPKYFC